MTHTRTAIILDGDVFIYKASAAAEVVTDWGGDLWTCHSFLEDALLNYNSMVSSAYERLAELGITEVERTTVALSDTLHNFRKDILPTYKENRRGRRKPVCYKPLLSWVEGHSLWHRYANLEGDDVMSILNDVYRKQGYDRVILVSVDKDFNSVPCEFFNINTGMLTSITEEDAERFHAYQTLVGDLADNYKGCPGYGDVKASRLLNNLDGNVWEAVINAFEKAGLSRAEALVQARVSHLLRDYEYDHATGMIKLWEFPENEYC